MLNSRETLKKDEILRGRETLQKLLKAGGRVHGAGVTLFFYLRTKKDLVL